MNVVINSGRSNDRLLGLTPLNPALEAHVARAVVSGTGVAAPVL